MANFFASMEFTDKLLSTNLVTRKLLLPTKSSPLKYNYKESTFIKLWNLSTKASSSSSTSSSSSSLSSSSSSS